MIRSGLIAKGLGTEPGFRWRGGDVSRIEGFGDAVFAFAVTLLVVSLEVPSTFDELLRTMSGFLAFGLCFAMLVLIWYYHYLFFRRYGLEDARTIVLNAILLFLVLFYIYPLKFLVGYLSRILLGFRLTEGGHMIETGQVSTLMIVYALGFVAIFGVLLLLYRHAYGLREMLELDAVEVFKTRVMIRHFAIYMAIGGTSLVLALADRPLLVAMSGWIYGLIGPAQWWNGARARRAEARMTAEHDAQLTDRR